MTIINLNRPGEDAVRLSALYEISLRQTREGENLLNDILQILLDKCSMNRGIVTLLSLDLSEILIEVSVGLTEKEKRRGRYRIGEGVIGSVVATGEPMMIAKISESAVFLNRTRSRQSGSQEISFYCVPVKSGSLVIGTLSVDQVFRDEKTCRRELEFLTVVAELIVKTVEARKRRYLENTINRVGDDFCLYIDKNKSRRIEGNSKAVKELYTSINQVAKSNATVILYGETGTGKELASETIHTNSLRVDGPYIKVNCAALPETLFESELFGHEKGAFTGAAAQKIGRFELAGGGTIFLDEIGELSLGVQVKLLRVLQEKQFERLGGTRTFTTDTRVIVATNRDLSLLVKEGKFREDLYYRLNVFPVHLPPLRERGADIILLADFFLEKYARENGKKINRLSTAAIDMLMSYHWPGNVRELENCMERAVLLTDEKVIQGHHLPPSLQIGASTDTPASLEEQIKAYENDLIIEALKKASGNQSEAARLLKTTKRVLSYKVKKNALDPHKYYLHSHSNG
ncbi:MAG: sigma-54 interaction domain-containing protein [bacterium]